MNEPFFTKEFLSEFQIASLPSPSCGDVTRLIPINHIGAVVISGTDSKTFLQGQLSCDMQQLSSHHSLLASLNTPKGRCISTLTLLERDESVILLLRNELIEKVRQTLAKYIVFSNAKIEAQSNSGVFFALSGINSPGILESILQPPQENYQVTQQEGISCIKIPGNYPRFLILAPVQKVQPLWDNLSMRCTITEASLWELEDIQAGIAETVAETSEQFLPHNLNLHLTGGISFEKGCYTGQEVIARMHYRGKAKAELMIARLECTESNKVTLSGSPIHYVTNGNKRALGEIVSAVKLDSNSFKVLALLPKNMDELLRDSSKILINEREFQLKEIELPPYAINNT